MSEHRAHIGAIHQAGEGHRSIRIRHGYGRFYDTDRKVGFDFVDDAIAIKCALGHMGRRGLINRRSIDTRRYCLPRFSAEIFRESRLGQCLDRLLGDAPFDECITCAFLVDEWLDLEVQADEAAIPSVWGLGRRSSAEGADTARVIVGYTRTVAEVRRKTAEMARRTGPKLKRTRVFVDDVLSIGRGWRHHMRSSRLDHRDTVDWFTTAEISVAIRQRPELGEQNRNRIANMQKCADMIDGWQLAPGGVFSMRHAIGEPTAARGFRSGPSLIDGALQEDSGGGICQVSTVLFNVALLGGLEILEKHNHRTDIWGDKRLIELGRDAAFAYAVQDLKFRNRLDFPVVLQLEIATDESALIGRAVSPEPLAAQIDVTSTVIERLLPEESFPASAHRTVVPGWKVHTVRTSHRARGSTVTFDQIDHYRPTTTIAAS